MGFARLRSRVGPPFIVLLSALLVTVVIPAPFFAASAPPRIDCRSLSAPVAARAALTTTTATPVAVTVRGQLSSAGELVGRSLTVQSGTSAAMAVALPNESFVGQPQGDVVVYTRYSASSGSEIRALNPTTRCDVRLAAPGEIVRSAVLDRSATALYLHSVTKAGRADAGVVRNDLQTGTATQVVPPLIPSDEFGPIFGTELRWSVDGRALAVQSCGLTKCLTRVLDIASGSLSVYDADGQGGLIALSADHLVTYAACGGLPCPVLAIDVHSGALTTLAASAFEVTAKPSGSSAILTIETSAGVVEVTQ